MLAAARSSVLEKSGTASTQTFTGTTVNRGSSAITASQNGGSSGMLLQLTAITRNAGSAVDFTNPSGTLSATTESPPRRRTTPRESSAATPRWVARIGP